MKTHFSLACLALACFLPTAWVREQKGDAKADYWNPKLSVTRRVEDLLARMTLEEKVGQMLCMSSCLIGSTGYRLGRRIARWILPPVRPAFKA